MIWAIQEELTRKCCNDSRAQHEPFWSRMLWWFRSSTWVFQKELTWAWSDQHSLVNILMAHVGLWNHYSILSWTPPELLILEDEFAVAFSGERLPNSTCCTMNHRSILTWPSEGVDVSMVWWFLSPTWVINSGEGHVRILWWFHSATWVFRENLR
jgi:hypothetical protein